MKIESEETYLSEKIIKSLALIIFILAASAGLVAIFFSHFPDHTKTQKKDVNTIAEENPDTDSYEKSLSKILNQEAPSK